LQNNFLQEKAVEAIKQKEEKRKKPKPEEQVTLLLIVEKRIYPYAGFCCKTISYKKKQWRPSSKKKKRGKNLSPRNRKACHSISIAHAHAAFYSSEYFCPFRHFWGDVRH
jgi:hypothetical protein